MARLIDRKRWGTKGTGRPIVMTEAVVQKLKEAFALGCSVEEACFYAEISKQSYYNWIEKRPELFDEFDRLMQKPVLMARQAVVQGLPGDKHFSYQFLKAKRPQEFAPEKVAIEHSGSMKTEIDLPESYKMADEARIRIKESLLANIKASAITKAKAEGKYVDPHKS